MLSGISYAIAEILKTAGRIKLDHQGIVHELQIAGPMLQDL